MTTRQKESKYCGACGEALSVREIKTDRKCRKCGSHQCDECLGLFNTICENCEKEELYGRDQD